MDHRSKGESANVWLPQRDLGKTQLKQNPNKDCSSEMHLFEPVTYSYTKKYKLLSEE